LYLLDSSIITHCFPGNLICSAGNRAIFSVKLFGEQNTMIDDGKTQCSSIKNYEDETHLVAKLFDNQIYTLQIQLYCVKPSDYENSYRLDPYFDETNCNTPHYLDVWIDLNNDGRFDDNTEQFRDDQCDYGCIKTVYDFSISIPGVDGRNIIEGSHRMRVLLTRDYNNRKSCYSVGYGEARDYTIQIVRKP
jgi:hypothetical protein